MKSRNLFLILSVFFVLLSCCACNSGVEKDGNNPQLPPDENLIQQEYTPIDLKFPNPERGFYKHTSSELGRGTGALNETVLKSFITRNNITLLIRIFYLRDFKDAPISAKALSDFDNDMDIIRRSGMKCILRFAYSEASDEPDAPLSVINEHLEQLQPHLEKNADVILVLQAGFIGAWGEWYYSSNNLNNTTSRNAVLKKILEVSPKDMMVQVRTPAYKQNYFDRTIPLTAEEAFTSQEIARVGHHNDCFLASSTDYGTYRNPATDKAYLNAECLYVSIGGETCPPSGISPANGKKAFDEMSYLRFTYLNEDYYRGVNNLWIADGYMDSIINKLGYRFELISGEYPRNVTQGGTLQASIKLKNVGFAPLYKARKAELILQHRNSGETHVAVLNADPRRWAPEEIITLDVKFDLPGDISEGEYDLYLNLPDMVLHDNPVYSIRFANKDTWEETSGYNNLQTIVRVEK